MSHTLDHLALAAEFPPASYEQWRKLAEAALEGRSLDDGLRSRTADGIPIEPLYPGARTAHHIARKADAGVPWQVLQRIDHPDPAAANAQAREDLTDGADGLVLVRAGSVGANGYGLPREPAALARVLEGTSLDQGAAIELDLRYSAALADICKERGIAPAALEVRFGFDPIGVAALNGGFARPWSESKRLAAKLVDDAMAQGFQGPFMVADGRVVHGAGGTEAHELAYVIAAAVAYLRALEANAIALDAARRMIFFRLTADADQFLTIVKFRSLRKLWRRIEESCGLAPRPTFISAETAWRTMTCDDPHLNIVRATIAVFAAGVGGADAVAVLPFTAARGLPDPFARRIARNTQLVLLHEANLAHVADPAAGTGWSEDLGDTLCRAAWSLFQEVEAAGGAPTALERGLIQGHVARARSEREQALANGRDALIGATLFPAGEQTPVEVLAAAPVTPRKPAIAVPIKALEQVRFAQPYEVHASRGKP